jgi:hypothetical protein
MKNVTINLKDCNDNDSMNVGNQSSFAWIQNPEFWTPVCFPVGNPYFLEGMILGGSAVINEKSGFSDLEFVKYLSEELIPKIDSQKGGEFSDEELSKVFDALPGAKEIVEKIKEDTTGGSGGGPDPVQFCVILVVFLFGVIVGLLARVKKKKKKVKN